MKLVEFQMSGFGRARYSAEAPSGAHLLGLCG